MNQLVEPPANVRTGRPPLPRLEVGGGEARPAAYSAFEPPKPSPPMVVARVLVWFWAQVKLSLRNAWHRRFGDDSVTARAVRNREAVQSIGGAAVAAAHQIAMRIDVLPMAVAIELSKLVDEREPIPLDYALARIEQAAGAPLEEVFDEIDPTPIASDTIACVYQARLLSGEKVAIKVRRETAALELNTERLALSLLIRWGAPFLPRGRLIFKHALDELPQLLLENLDFKRVVRLQQLFRKQVRKTRLKNVDAAKVYLEMCSEDVIVSEFVSGIWLAEVIAAQENEDDEALATLAEQNIDPSICARRLLDACWWSFFENIFICQMPEPTHIVVRPGNKLVFINLADTGIVGWRQANLLREALSSLSKHDVEGAVGMLTQLLHPLPFIDVHEFTKRIEGAMWTELFAMENRDTPAWERAGTGLWLAFLRIARRYDVSLRLDISRMVQALCMFTRMATRLKPRLRVLREFKRYQRRANRRRARLAMKKLRKAARRDQLFIQRLSTQSAIMSRMGMWAESAVDNLPMQHSSLTKKGAYSTSQLLWATEALVAIATVATGGVMLYHWFALGIFDPRRAIHATVMHPLFIVPLVTIFFTTLRRILFRLEDIDRGT